LKSSLLLLLRLTVLQSSVPLQLPDRELDAFSKLFLGVVAVPLSISLPSPKVERSFHARVIPTCKSSSNPPKTMAASVLGKRHRQSTTAEGTNGRSNCTKSKLLIFGSQIQLSRFAAEKDAPSTQHQRSIVTTTMVSLKRGRPKMRARPWISIIGRTPSQAPPARQPRVTYCRNVLFRTIVRLSTPTMALRLRRCRKQSQVCTLHPCHGP
jgi:hypothetical protein